MKSFLKTNLTWSVVFMLLLPSIVLLGSCTDDKKEEKVPENTSFSWAKASVAEVENKLKEAYKKQDANINSLVSSVKSNENVSDAFI